MNPRTKIALGVLFLAVLWVGLLLLLIPVAGGETSERFVGDLLLDRHNNLLKYLTRLIPILSFISTVDVCIAFCAGAREKRIESHRAILPG